MPKKSQKCISDGCRKKRGKNSRLCYACRQRRYRKNNRMKASYQALKYNSKRRKIFFDLTFEEFEEFAIETDYLSGVGKTALSYSVDRIIEELGYTKGNLQRLSLGDNSRKEAERRRRRKTLVYDYATGWATVHKSPPPEYQSVI